MKTRSLLIAGLALLVLAAAVLLSRKGAYTLAAGKITLGYDVCLAAGSGYQVVEEDAPARLSYLRRYWADSTRQFFSKTLASPEGDTLFVSVFNNASLKTSQELLLDAGFKALRKEQGRAGGVPVVKMLARSPEGLFFLRYFIDSPKFRTVTMVDQPGADSSRLAQQFNTGTFIQKIEKCLSN